MSNRSIHEFAKVLLLVGGVVALIGGLLGLVAGFVDAGTALALVVGIISLYYYGRLTSQSVVLILLILGIILTATTGGIASFGGILVSIAAIMALVVRYNG